VRGDREGVTGTFGVVTGAIVGTGTDGTVGTGMGEVLRSGA